MVLTRDKTLQTRSLRVNFVFNLANYVTEFDNRCHYFTIFPISSNTPKISIGLPEITSSSLT